MAFLLPEVIQPIAAYHYLYILPVRGAAQQRKDIGIILSVRPRTFILFNYFPRFKTYPAGRYNNTGDAAHPHLNKSFPFRNTPPSKVKRKIQNRQGKYNGNT